MSNLGVSNWGKLVSLIVVCSLLFSVPLFGPAVSATEECDVTGIAYLVHEICQNDMVPLLDDLKELKTEGKIDDFDTYMLSYQMPHFWANLDQYSIIFLEKHSVFRLRGTGVPYKTWLGVSLDDHKAELEAWIRNGGCFFVEDQNNVSGNVTMSWDWLPADLQVTSREIRQGSDNLEVINDPGIFSTPNSVDVTKATQDQGNFVDYEDYTPVVRDKVTGEKILIYRQYGDGLVMLSHLNYPNADPYDVDYVENLINFCCGIPPPVCTVTLAASPAQGRLGEDVTVCTQGFDPSTMQPDDWTITGVGQKVDGPEQVGNEWCQKVTSDTVGDSTITFTYTANGQPCSASVDVSWTDVCTVSLTPPSQEDFVCNNLTVSTQGFDSATMVPVGSATDNYTAAWTITCDQGGGHIVEPPSQVAGEWSIKVHSNIEDTCEITFSYTVDSTSCTTPPVTVKWRERECTLVLEPASQSDVVGTTFTVSTQGFDTATMVPEGSATNNYKDAWTECGHMVGTPYQDAGEWHIDVKSDVEDLCEITFSYTVDSTSCTTSPVTVEWIQPCVVELVPPYQRSIPGSVVTFCTDGFDPGTMMPGSWTITCDEGGGQMEGAPYQAGDEWCIKVKSDIEDRCEITFSYTVGDKSCTTGAAVVEWIEEVVQLEKVPQVRWAGEKIVLEQRFGAGHAGNFVQFMLEGGSPGILESIEGTGTGSMVATTVTQDGIARAILTSEKPGECDVSVALYGNPSGSGQPIDQHGFVVFFLKLESVNLAFVDGAREEHDAGPWTPANPWDSASDLTVKELNVSQDALLRMRVKGWFMGDNLSTRPEAPLDYDGDGVADITLPKGRWVLPDDWEKLAGPEWEDRRPRWDIMDGPGDDVTAPDELGPYDGDVNVPAGEAKKPVIGPLSSLDDYSGIPVVPADSTVNGNRTTVVPNGELDWWDSPMPAAKVIFKITDGPGYLKELDKGEIYKEDSDYTNPFYEVEIPASDLIPPVVSNGGYSWDSWGEAGGADGPYGFWIALVPVGSGGDPPTELEVYSDNHGEAMVYLNGDHNLDLTGWQSWSPGDVIAVSKVTATVDYPYLRKHQAVVSPPAIAKLTWGKEVKVHVQQMMRPDPSYGPDIMRKLVTVYLCDRDGKPIVGEKVEWTIDGPAGMIESLLEGTSGVITTPHKRSATSYSRLPTEEEKAKYKEVFGEDCHHGIVGAVIFDSLRTTVDLHMAFYEEEGILFRSRNLHFAVLDTADPLEELYQGVNLVTYKGPTMAVADAVVTMPSGALVSVWHFGNEDKEWEVYVPGAPPYASDLERMVYLEPYAIVVNRDFTWVY